MSTDQTLTPDEWAGILQGLGVRATTARAHAPAFAEFVVAAAFSKGWSEVDDFVAQIVHESAKLEQLEENLNYRAERLVQVWPKRFPDLASARPFGGKPAALAEKVYGGRLGNDQPGDGFRYRGRGYLMITGKDNYEQAQAATGDPLVDKPELASNPRIALKTAIAWWNRNIPDSMVGNAAMISRRVNGGSIGLPDRLKLSKLSDKLINAQENQA